MENFQIDPELCLIVRAFSQAEGGSLRDVSRALGCDASSLVRKVQRISAEHGLMQKIRGRWALTESGRRAAQWVEESIASQKQWMSQKARLRIATTAWMSEQVVVPGLKSLQHKTGNRFVWTVRTGGSDFEKTLLDGSADYVIACHPPRDPAVAHRKVIEEKWIAIAPRAWAKLEPDALKDRPFIRHEDLNLALGESHDLLLDNLIGIRSAVESGHGWSCVPEPLVLSALKAGTIARVDLPVPMSSDVCLWWLRARKDTGRETKAMALWLAGALRPGT